MTPRVGTMLAILACGGPSREAIRARDRLAGAMERRDPVEVSAAAREADRFRGRDPSLDRLLGDALANVLLKPEDGMALLLQTAAPGDPAWRSAALDAAVRTGRPDAIQAVRAAMGEAPTDLSNPVVEQVVARARRDPATGWEALVEAVSACTLLDARPRKGKGELDLPAPADLPAAARRLGADRVVIGRAEAPADPDPLLGGGDWRCAAGRVVPGDRLPELIPRGLVVGAHFPAGSLWVWIQDRDGQPWAYAASDPERAAAWLTLEMPR